jgi:hypothetical protein
MCLIIINRLPDIRIIHAAVCVHVSIIPLLLTHDRRPYVAMRTLSNLGLKLLMVVSLDRIIYIGTEQKNFSTDRRD